MSFKLGEKNIVAWIFVGALQFVALMLLVPVAATIHQKYFAIIFGDTAAWFLAIGYGLAEVLAFAVLPMMHTAFKNKRLRVMFPVTLLCFLIAVAYDVYINNDVFKKRQADYAQTLIDNRVKNEVEKSDAANRILARIDRMKLSFDTYEPTRIAERNRNRRVMSEYDSLSLAYAKIGWSITSRRYADLANRLRNDVSSSESLTQNEKTAIEKLESQYNAEIEKTIASAKVDGNKLASAEASSNWFNDFCKHYPGIIFLVLAVIVSGVSGFVVDKYGLIVYEKRDTDRREAARKRWSAMLIDIALAKIFKRGDVVIEKKAELATKVRFSDDRGMATKQLYEMELTGADKKFKDMGIYPRQAFASQFGMSLQAVHNRLKDYEKRLFESKPGKDKQGNGSLTSSLPSSVDV